MPVMFGLWLTSLMLTTASGGENPTDNTTIPGTIFLCSQFHRSHLQFLPEWLAFHQTQGVTAIHLFHDESAELCDGAEAEGGWVSQNRSLRLLRSFVDEGFLTLTEPWPPTCHVCEHKLGPNIAEKQVPCQFAALPRCLGLATARRMEWLAWLDVDEVRVSV